jgi:hypothetical protein
MLPAGGKLTGGNNLGFDNLSGLALSSDDTGSQSWTIADIDGDGKADLIVTAQLQGGNVTSFSPSSAQYWKVYSNDGTGFSTTPLNWSLPAGGKLSGGMMYGFSNITGAAAGNDDTGSQSWSFIDMDGDKKADLVVTAQLTGRSDNQFFSCFGAILESVPEQCKWF